MTFIELSGLIIVMIIGVIALVTAVQSPAVLLEFRAEGSPILAVLAGVSLAFFACTGFENAANVAEETVDPARAFPRALIGGMFTAGIIYTLVSIAAALAVPIDTLAGNTLLEVIRADLFIVPAAVMIVIFGLIAMTAISNTTLVTVTAQARILYGMAREDIVPSVFAKIHPTRRSPYVALIFGTIVVAALLLVGAGIRSSQAGAGVPADERLDIVDRLATITVVFLLFIYALVIVACLKVRGRDEHPDVYRANTPILILGIIGNLVVLVYTVATDPESLFWVAGLLAVGLVLYLLERFFGKNRLRPPGIERGDPEAAEPPPGQGALSHALHRRHRRLPGLPGRGPAVQVDRRLPRDHRRDRRRGGEPVRRGAVRQRAGPAAAPPSSTELSFAEEAETAVDIVAAEFDGWGPTIHKQIRSGSPAQEIIRAAEDLDADLISLAAGSRGLTRTILLGSTASRVQHSAPCPVLVCRPTPKSERATTQT